MYCRPTGPYAYRKSGITVKHIGHEEGSIVHLTLQKSTALPTHATPVNVAFSILEGAVRIDIGIEPKVFKPNMLIKSPRDIPHALTHTDPEKIARFLVIKMPRP